MGALCGCEHKNSNMNTQGLPMIKDPRLVELSTHLKILDSKLNTNISSIEDFK